jgi:catechol 2,3-dioxygenase-like lactoylglutathione lyase family enzyme
MDVRFIASFAIISAAPAADRRLFVDALGLDLQAPMEGSDYVFTETLGGAKHFAVWPLRDAAEACFGLSTWPESHSVPQASIEFEVDDVEAAARELVDRGYDLLHPTRTEPWGQVIARVQSPDGVVVGVCFTPHLHDA